MNVSTILRRKGTYVETARPEISFLEAARRLTHHGIGSLVILDDVGELVGVLSERDLVQAVAEHGPSCWNMPVGEVLKERPTTCKPEDPLREVMAIMTRRRVRHLPVLAGEAIVGLVSIGDVVSCQLEELQLEVGVLRDYARGRS
ncbi:MAG: CBS domain-containing protein [Proteobacteria bacterium]|nr:CBS domain-containing protein [Pseudomonadota bacterium]